MERRSLIGWLGVGVLAGMTGCDNSSAGSSDPAATATPTNDRADQPSCDAYAHQSTATDTDGQLPWHLAIDNISLKTASVSISITDASGNTADEAVSCTAADDNHSKLVFDLSPDTAYRVDVRLDRLSGSETASTTVTGWGRVTGPNECLEVTVEDGELRVHRIHYDRGVTPPARRT